MSQLRFETVTMAILPTGSEPVAGRDWAELKSALVGLVDRLDDLEHGKLMGLALETILELAQEPADRLDWKILTGALVDMQRAIETFQAYRRIRKVTIFGSARTPRDRPEYQAAHDFAACMAQRGFMVLTGAGEGIMQAGNEGAGADRSFGLNIQLPFEQSANPVIAGDSKLINFKYFFTRKLSFIRESDAVALFPGGFGTQDEAFEVLTLSQTGKYGPAPIVLLDRPGGSYWRDWEAYQRDYLLKNGLIHADDLSLYMLTDRADVACNYITNFYRVYHSSRYVGDRFVIRLRTELSDAIVASLNEEFSDLLASGSIEKSQALPGEDHSNTQALPRLVMTFNQKNLGRLHQMIWRINDIDVACDLDGPECK